MKSFLGFASYYRKHIKNVAHITSSLWRLCSKDVVLEITKERRYAYERIKHELTNAPVLILPDFELTFKLYIDAACSQGLQLKYSEARYGETQTEYMHGLGLSETQLLSGCNGHMLRWRIAIQEYRGNMTIIYKEGKWDTNSDGLSRWPLDNFKRNPAYEPELAAKIPTHFIEIDRKKNFRLSEWETECGTPES
ncbi:hypothetical protein O181_046233 [Austropuccinia psidii MF-1]|uniref:Uncharacterized protein n=1 Tax=Austropuccinia psidii MF-1 TaxID=1389203 RepID=A0A9Q3DTM1_9BASI|nr:hypothetical protein [Austropuccinia psidii MF-1]